MSKAHQEYKRTALVFAMVFVWKAALWLFTAQPIPANDSFFYDGAVVNYLTEGRYVNPSLSEALPISATKIFSAYPPLYQGVLFPWMWVFGTSAKTAMALHLGLFGGYLAILGALFRRMNAPAWCANLGALFAVTITFHDRPDSLAHLLGVFSFYALVRSRKFFDPAVTSRQASVRAWAALIGVVLCVATSFQIGAIYLLLVSFGLLGTRLLHGDPFPVKPWLATLMIVAAVVVGVVKVMPGFMEHARLTPSWTGLRFPQPMDLLKVGRTVPGLLAVMVLLPCTWFKQRRNFEEAAGPRLEMMTLIALIPAGAVLIACLFLLTPNTIGIASYLQPVAVAGYLGICAALFPGLKWLKSQTAILTFALCVASVRLIGMTTWGAVCSLDVDYGTAIRAVRNEIKETRPDATIVLSAAYLYEAANHPETKAVHSDWPGKPEEDALPCDLDALLWLKPDKIILTQFDYYRRYEEVVEQLRELPEVQHIQVSNLATVTAPDALPTLRKVIQHISWAPVIIKLQWPEPS